MKNVEMKFRKVRFRKGDPRRVDFGTHELQAVDVQGGNNQDITIVLWDGDWWYLDSKLKVQSFVSDEIRLRFDQHIAKEVLR